MSPPVLWDDYLHQHICSAIFSSFWAGAAAESEGGKLKKVRSHSSGAVFFDSLVSGSFPFSIGGSAARLGRGSRAEAECWSGAFGSGTAALLFAEVRLSGNGFKDK